MKKLIALIGSLLIATSLFAQNSSITVVRQIPATTVTNLLSGRYLIEEWSFYNTNAATTALLKAYDWASGATSVVRASYIYRTNVLGTNSLVYTNSASLTATNTEIVRIATNVTAAAVTNEQTRLREYQMAAATDAELANPPQVARGLTVLSDAAGWITITYRLPQ